MAGDPPRPRCDVGARCVLLLAAVGCAPQGVRDVKVEGLPSCPKGRGYAQQVVVRLDRDRALFDEPLVRIASLDAPPLAPPVFSVPRGRMLATLRAGLCARTSLGTWDCKAVTWLSTQQIQLDGGRGPFVARLPPLHVDCAR